jgi:hypothetical protein
MGLKRRPLGPAGLPVPAVVILSYIIAVFVADPADPAAACRCYAAVLSLLIPEKNLNQSMAYERIVGFGKKSCDAAAQPETPGECRSAL